MEADGDGFVRQQRGCVFANDAVQMINPKRNIRFPISRASAAFAAGLAK